MDEELSDNKFIITAITYIVWYNCRDGSDGHEIIMQLIGFPGLYWGYNALPHLSVLLVKNEALTVLAYWITVLTVFTGSVQPTKQGA